ncbi:hypothetical protein MW887_007166 [Aspergillus wentii]|nr:hypothetical protein MW887_007166 [Aspergillus wentii]
MSVVRPHSSNSSHPRKLERYKGCWCFLLFMLWSERCADSIFGEMAPGYHPYLLKVP